MSLALTQRTPQTIIFGKKLKRLTGWLNQTNKQKIQTSSTESPLADLQDLLDDLERTYLTAPKRSGRGKVEPPTEQQKIIDMAG